MQVSLRASPSAAPARARRSRALRCFATAQKHKLDVVVVGSGVGGLTLGRALLDAGINVRIYERRSKEKALEGAGGLMLQANAAAVLDLISSADGTSNLGSQIVTTGGPIKSGGFCQPNGSKLYYADVSSVGLEKLTSNGLSIGRPALQGVLLSSLPEGVVSFGASFKSFEKLPGGRVRVHFEGQGAEPVECDVLVGADGMRSQVRAQLFGPEPAAPSQVAPAPGTGTGAGAEPCPLKYSGAACWRWRLPLSKLPGGAAWFDATVARDSWDEYWGKGVRCGWFDAGKGAESGEREIIFYVFAARPESWQPSSLEAELAAVREALQGFTAPVPQILAATDAASLHVAKIYDRDPLPGAWGHGAVTLLGDAAHPVLPTLGQGACMAIEDAFELANALGALLVAKGGQVPSHIELEGTLRAFEAVRGPRVAKVCEQSRQIHELSMFDSDAKVFIRDWIYKLTPKWAGDAQFAYLFKEYRPSWSSGVKAAVAAGKQ